MSQESKKEDHMNKLWGVIMLVFLGALFFGIVVAKHLHLPPPHHSSLPAATQADPESPSP